MEKIIVAVIVIAAAYLAFRMLRKQNKQGGCNCSKSCRSCDDNNPDENKD